MNRCASQLVRLLTDLGRVSPPGHVLGPDGFLDAVHLLLVALAVACGVLLGLLQTQAPFLASPASNSAGTSETGAGSASPFLQRLSSFSSQLMVFLRVLFFSFSLSYFCFHCSAVSSMFTVTVFLMVFSVLLGYLCPNIRVDLVSASL
uniref:Transmembrane protein n=1 Tax=Poecilia latipinna TaxID=48699 RepID=A0A3B3VG60_9TELE